MEGLHDSTKMSCYSICGSEFKIGKGKSERSVKYWIAAVSVKKKQRKKKTKNRWKRWMDEKEENNEKRGRN